METLARDLRYAARALARTRGVSVAAMLTLALGIGATTTMFAVVHAALWRPLPFDDADSLVMLYVTRTTPSDGRMRLRWSRPVIEQLRGTASFEAIASFSSATIAVAGGADAPEQMDGEVVAPSYFRVMRVSPALGRPFLDEEDGAAGAHPVAIISDRLWRRRFNADPALVGGTVRVNDVALTIVGVMPPTFSGLSGRADVWVPRTMAPILTYSEYLTSPQHFISVVARLRRGVSATLATAELAAMRDRFADRERPPDAQWGALALPVREARVDPTLRRSVLMLLAAAVCVLLIACVNVAALMLARGRARRREIAIRLAIGSDRRRLVQQLLTEAALLAAIAGVAGVLFAAWSVEVLASASPATIASFINDYLAVASFAAPRLDVRVVGFAFAATIGTTVLFALLPALDASRQDLATVLRHDDRTASRGKALPALVVSEIALAVLLLTAAGLLIESFTRIASRRAGFEPDRVITFWIRPPNSRYAPADGPAIVERMLTRIEQVPGVDAAAVNRATPFMGGSRSTVFFPDRPNDRASAPPVGRHYVSADYFRALGIPVRAGRTLTVADRAGRPPVAVVNESGARRFWPGENPIGKRVWFGTTTGPFSDRDHAVEIVGVVGDVKYFGADDAIGADFYTSYLQFAYPDTMVMVKARGAAEALVPALRAAVASVDAAVPIYDVMSLDDRVSAALARPRFNAALAGAFAASALLLAAIGVYGVLSYSVSARMREIGVRVALGADARRVIALVVGDGMRLAIAGAAIGVAGAIAVTRLMQGLLAGVAPTDPRILSAGAIVMLAVAAIAAWLPARRASAVDPIVVLRQE
jgi:putative ABC transport system permease protein